MVISLLQRNHDNGNQAGSYRGIAEGIREVRGLFGDDGLSRQLKKALVERALGAELTQHLGYERGDGELTIDVPRDRNSNFEPLLVPKGETHFDGFGEKIISMYAHGMTVREIREHLEELYGLAISPDLPALSIALSGIR